MFCVDVYNIVQKLLEWVSQRNFKWDCLLSQPHVQLITICFVFATQSLLNESAKQQRFSCSTSIKKNKCWPSTDEFSLIFFYQSIVLRFVYCLEIALVTDRDALGTKKNMEAKGVWRGLWDRWCEVEEKFAAVESIFFLKRVDRGRKWWNNFFSLFWMSLMPFPASFHRFFPLFIYYKI